MFLASDKGMRVLNFFYSWGAAVVILGAMFKLLHLPYGDIMLAVGMITEFFVFFVFGFEKPTMEYHWEEVFPVLKSKNPMDRPPGYIKGTADDNSNSNGTQINVGNVTNSAGLGALDVSQDDAKNLSDSIKKLSGAADQISKMAELTEATQKYLEQLTSMSDQMAQFTNVTSSLTNVSDTLLNSYKSITDNSDGISQHSRGYVQQMEMLNRNISGLNTIYEIQLKSISSQIDTIEHINGGLNRIKDLYDGSVVDSSVFRSETEKMAQQLGQLNQVYSRLLQAMTVNMYGGAPAPGAYQNPYTNNPDPYSGK